MSAVKEKWTARGTGKCPSCSATYSTFRKPPNCDQCNFFLGGRYVSETVSRKRRKLDNPSAVKVCTFGGNNLYSMKVTSRDGRCFCLVSDTSRLCYYSSCKSFRSVTAASGQEEMNKFSCKHLDEVKNAVAAVKEYHLSPQQVSEYPGGSDVHGKMLDSVNHAKVLGVPQVIRVSETSYAVCGMPDTFAENGIVHLKQVNGTFSCVVKNCRTITGGKQLKPRYVCLHIHLLSCCLGLWKSSPLPTTATCTVTVNSPVSSSTTALPSAASSSNPPIPVSSNLTASISPLSSSTPPNIAVSSSTIPTCGASNIIPIDSASSSYSTAATSSTSNSGSSPSERNSTGSTSATSSVTRTSTVKLNLASWYPYHIPLNIINAARDCDCNTWKDTGGGWPKEFIPQDQNCRLCGTHLRPPRCHPGSQGKGLLITNMNPFLEVNIKVKMCERVDCQAMQQPQVYDLGKVTCSSILEYLFTSYMYILYMHVKSVSRHFRNEAHILYRRFKSIISTSFFKVFLSYICMIISWQCPTSTHVDVHKFSVCLYELKQRNCHCISKTGCRCLELF